MVDQFPNAASAVAVGAAERLDYSKLNETEVFDSVIKIMDTPKYRVAAHKLSTLLQSSNGRIEGANILELMAQLKDISFFIPVSDRVPWYVSLHLDILLFAVVVVYIAWISIKQCCISCCCKSKVSQKLIDPKNNKVD